MNIDLGSVFIGLAALGTLAASVYQWRRGRQDTERNRRAAEKIAETDQVISGLQSVVAAKDGHIDWLTEEIDRLRSDSANFRRSVEIEWTAWEARRADWERRDRERDARIRALQDTLIDWSNERTGEGPASGE